MARRKAREAAEGEAAVQFSYGHGDGTVAPDQASAQLEHEKDMQLTACREAKKVAEDLWLHETYYRQACYFASQGYARLNMGMGELVLKLKVTVLLG